MLNRNGKETSIIEIMKRGPDAPISERESLRKKTKTWD